MLSVYLFVTVLTSIGSLSRAALSALKVLFKFSSFLCKIFQIRAIPTTTKAFVS